MSKTRPTFARRIVDTLVPTPFPTRVRECDYKGEYGETPRREVIRKMRASGVRGQIPGEDYEGEYGEAKIRRQPDSEY